MGFKTGAICTVFSVEPVTDKITKLRVAISRKVQGTEPPEYEQEFGGFIKVMGLDAARAASKLREKDRIVLGDVDVTNRYVREKQQEYTDFKVFGFKMADEVFGKGESPQRNSSRRSYEGENEAGDDGDLPF